eukprot:TRINITY_DN8472_c0_g1_i1.p2 TRINITY_DN8472_c0_g1~~TRINITY_DN8472_c0_g1_i1.p2  ORF type:complete len:141 (-),score=12.71 TRINITY_DN8472_c0_g1_i1:513-935(-)
MPKIINPMSLIQELGGTKVWVYDSPNKNLGCKPCSKFFNMRIKANLIHHVKSIKHKKRIELLNKKKSIEFDKQTWLDARPTFIPELVRMMIACDIPLAKVETPELINFFEKYSNKKTSKPDNTNQMYGEGMQSNALSDKR